jgi:hypothetical protein
MPATIGLLFVANRARPRMPSVRVPQGRVPGWSTFACAALTPVFLVGWTLLLKPDVADLVRMVPHLAPIWLVIGGVAFAAINASFEEWI